MSRNMDLCVMVGRVGGGKDEGREGRSEERRKEGADGDKAADVKGYTRIISGRKFSLITYMYLYMHLYAQT